MKTEEEIGRLLREKGLKIALAESCTGGLIAKKITDVAGASDYFEMGLVTYSNRAKERFLGVPGGLIAQKGAVSPEVAEAMAEGVRKAAGVDLGVSVTGIAGPGGGSPEKPVGTVYIGVAFNHRVAVRKCFFGGDREAIREATCTEAIDLALRCLKGQSI